MGDRADARAALRPGDGHAPMAPEIVAGTLATAIEAAARRYPERVAIRVGGVATTYGELDRAANRVAHAVAAAGVVPAEPVLVVARQTAEMVVAIVGVLKAGCAYVPVDPTGPAERGRDVAGRIGARAVVADPASCAEAGVIVGSGPIVATLEPGGPATPPPRHDDPAAPAYVYFTSGSTGRPKGVTDSHRNVLDNVRRYTDSLAIGPGDRLSLIQTIAFSGAVSSLFSALVNGATTLPFDVRAAGLEAMRAWVADERLTMFHSVPILFRALADGDRSYPDLRVVRLEGDAAAWSDAALAARCLGPGAVLVNGLGATETGLVRQFFVDRDTPIGSGGLPLGHPVDGVEVEIDRDEIVVVGSHLALGYWGDADRTAAAFEDRGDGRRAYRTGDLGRLEADGCLVGLGRRDHAEKIRGDTVDLAEVEARLRSHADVADAVAITRRDGATEPRLVAYVVPVDGRTIDPPALRRSLAKVLPASAVPSTIVGLDALPLDPSAKVDRAALPAPGRGRPNLAMPFRAPGTDLEREIVEIWERLLDVRPIGVDDDFFDLGGDSLDAARLVSELEALAPRDVADDLVLTASTVADVAARLSATRAAVPTWFALHEDRGNAGFYAHVARAAAGAVDLRTIGPDAGERRSLAIEDIAAEAVDRIRARSPVGPYRVLGFCFAGPVALEVARRLEAAGEDVVGLALLGISPLEFSGLVDPAGLAERPRAQRVRRRIRAHMAEARRLGPRKGFRHLSLRAVARTSRSLRRWARRPYSVDARAAAVRAYVARPFGGTVHVILGHASAVAYTRSPDVAWRRLGRTVEVTVIPGDDHAMLVGDGAAELARTLVAASRTGESMASSTSHAGAGVPPGSVAGGVP